MEEARRFLVAYDISHDGRRNRIAKLLETYGDRVQYSVFIVDARPAKLTRLTALLEAAMIDEDAILVADLGLSGVADQRRFLYLGRRRTTTPHTSLVL